MTLDWASFSPEYDWHEWRRNGLGSSEAATLLGTSPWKTLYDLLMEKTGEKPSDFKGNFATERGKELEPIVRDMYNMMRGCNAVPERATYPQFEPFRANADGVDRQKGILIEIKCPGKVDHAVAHEGRVPDKYMPQCQWLMMIFGYERMDYVSYYYKTEEMLVLPVHRNESMVAELQSSGRFFWRMVTERIDFLKDKK